MRLPCSSAPALPVLQPWESVTRTHVRVAMREQRCRCCCCCCCAGGYDLHYAPSANCGAGCDTIDWANNATYSTTVYTATAIERLKALQGAQRPWFMYLAYQAVHAPQEVPQVRAACVCVCARARGGGVAARVPSCPRAWVSPRCTAVHCCWTQHYVWPYNATIADPSRRQFAGMVSALDEGVGKYCARGRSVL